MNKDIGKSGLELVTSSDNQEDSQKVQVSNMTVSSDEVANKKGISNKGTSNKVTGIEDESEQIIEWIKSRRSIGNLNIPAPNEAQIQSAIQCAMTAPDHKKLQPWRFIIVKGNARHEMGRALLEAAKAKAERDGNELDEATSQKTLKMPLRAPLIVTVVTKMSYHEKVPPFEQLLSAGAAVQNLILALKAQGFDTVWRTGPLSNEPSLKSYFNVGFDDYIVAFVYVGTSVCKMPTREDIDTNGFLSYK